MKQKFLIQILIIVFLYTANSCKTNNSDKLSIKINEIYPSTVSPGSLIYILGEGIPDSTLIVRFGKNALDSIIKISKNNVIAYVPEELDYKEGNKIDVKLESFNSESNMLQCLIRKLPTNVPQLYYANKGINKGCIKNEKMKIKRLFDVNFARGMHIDTISNEFYYGTFYGDIYKVNLLNPKQKTTIFKLEEGLMDFAIDQEEKAMYYSTQTTINKISLTQNEQRDTLISDRFLPSSLKLSDDKKSLYWIESQSAEILKCNLDSNVFEVDVILNKSHGLKAPNSISLDQKTSKLYISETSEFGSSRIMVADLSGEGSVKTILSTKDNIGVNVNSIVLDKKTNYLYWMNSLSEIHSFKDGDIRRVNLEDESNLIPEIILYPIRFGYLLTLPEGYQSIDLSL